MKNKKGLFLGSAFVLVILFIVSSVLYKKSQSDKYSFLASEQSEIFVRDYSPRYGASDAKVFLTEFLDPECESCRAFYPEVKNILKDFEGKVQLVVRYAAFHKNSQIAIRAIEAARYQGKYWESLELLFKFQPHWGSHHAPKPELIFEYLPTLGLDMDKLRKDMTNPQIAEIITQDMNDLRTLKVRGTPTFFVNGIRLERFGSTYLRELLESEVKKYY